MAGNCWYPRCHYSPVFISELVIIRDIISNEITELKQQLTQLQSQLGTPLDDT